MSVITGEVKTSELGVTLTHEHFNLNFEKFYTQPPPNLKPYFDKEYTLETVGYIRQYPYSSKKNINFSGESVDSSVIDEMKNFKLNGGGCVVENTSHGIERNLKLMVKVSKETGVHVVAGTGHYVDVCQQKSTLNKSVEEMCSIIKRDMTEGCEELPTVRTGFIGEVGSSWPITDFEKRAIQATALAQLDLGCAVSFHPGRDPKAPGEILRIYAEAGGDMRKADMSHLDRTLVTEEQLLEFAQINSYCQFDLFGTETSFYQLHPTRDMLSDAQRIEKIKLLISEGKADKILVSHDIHTRHRLANFGGHGFSHLLVDVVPQMEIKGIDPAIIKQIMVSNPAEWLSTK